MHDRFDVHDAMTIVRSIRGRDPGQPIRYAIVISADAVNGRVTVRPSNAIATDGSQDCEVHYLSSTCPAVGAKVRIDVTARGDVVVVGAPGVDAFPAAPFATAAGAITVNLTNGAGATAQAVTFPTDRFTTAPVISLTNCGGTGSSAVNLQTQSTPTSSGFTILAVHKDVAGTFGAGQSVLVHWTATQMTSTSGAG